MATSKGNPNRNGVSNATTNRYKSDYTYDANGNIETVERYDNAGGHYDSFAYQYQTSTTDRKLRNRLYDLYDDATNTTGVDIVAPAGTFDNDPTDVNANNNYRYDALGNLIHVTREYIEDIQWTVAGKVKSIARPTGSPREPLSFGYGASGQRIMKQVADPDNALEPTGYREHYIRDAQGNIMATYRFSSVDGIKYLNVEERPLYGSSRLGTFDRREYLRNILTPAPVADVIQPMNLKYELTDHLGNVCAVVSGRLLDGGGSGSAKQAEVISANGYEPFGSLLPGRNYSSDSYRFGFNGSEKDDEVLDAAGTYYTTEFRGLDPRIGRWISIDPLASSFPWQSPYAAFNNAPIRLSDKTGLAASGDGGEDEPEIPGSDGPAMFDDGPEGSSSRIIGQRGRLETGQAAQSHGPGNPIIPQDPYLTEDYAHMYSWSDDQLFGQMNQILGRAENGGRLLNHFRGNTGSPLTTSFKTLRGSPTLQRLRGDIQRAIEAQIRASGPFASDVSTWNISNAIRPPGFPLGTWDENPIMPIDYDMAVEMGGTQRIVVNLVSADLVYHQATISSRGAMGAYWSYNLSLEVSLVDNFGVDEGDVQGPGAEEIMSQWILQHQRGYKPFANTYVFPMRMSGTVR